MPQWLKDLLKNPYLFFLILSMMGSAINHIAPIFLQIEKFQYDLHNQPLTKAELYPVSTYFSYCKKDKSLFN